MFGVYCDSCGWGCIFIVCHWEGGGINQGRCIEFEGGGWQCCSYLFVSGRTLVYLSHYKRPQFPPKVDFGGPNYRLKASHVASHIDWPSKTLLTVRPAQHDDVLLRRMTTTALGGGQHSKNTKFEKDGGCMTPGSYGDTDPGINNSPPLPFAT